jgi:glycosyltransferase involved in cell wall biosynthesis
MRNLSIIVPAYNEEKRIGKMLSAYSDYFENLRINRRIEYQILVVINNTTDKTVDVVESVRMKNERIGYLNLRPGGKGFAVLEGFKESLRGNFEYVGFVDADMATPPEEFWRLFVNLREYDGIIADRYLRGSKIYPPVTFARLFARRLFNFAIRSMLLLPFGDTQCGAKIFRRKAVESVLESLSMSKWAFDVDLLYNLRKKGFRIRAWPTNWHDREYSKINFWQAGPWMFLGILRLRMLNSPARKFIRVYDRLVRYVPK